MTSPDAILEAVAEEQPFERDGQSSQDDGWRIQEDHPELIQPILDVVKVSIARLSHDEILRMKHRDIVEVVRLSEIAFLTHAGIKYLHYMDRDELERMAFLARRSCRRMVNVAYEQQGHRAPFVCDF